MAILITDSFTGANGDAWNATTWPVVRNHYLTSALPTIQSNRGQHALDGGDTAAQVCFTAPTLINCEIRVTYTPVTTNRIYPEIGWRVGTNISSGHPTDGYAMQWITDLGIVRLVKIQSYDWFTQTGLGPVATTGSWKIYIRVKGPRHRIKIWPAAAAEPDVWLLDGTDTTYTSGQVYLGGANNDAHEAVTFAWDDFSLLELLPPPAGMYIDNTAIVGLNVGTVPVVAAYQGTVEIPIP
jgi:hypothetical protein